MAGKKTEEKNDRIYMPDKMRRSDFSSLMFGCAHRNFCVVLCLFSPFLAVVANHELFDLFACFFYNWRTRVYSWTDVQFFLGRSVPHFWED